jgi:hypothetical protein
MITESETEKIIKEQDDWIYHDRFGDMPREDFMGIDVDALFKNKKDQYPNGLI